MPFVHYRNQTITLKCPECKGTAVYDHKKIIDPLYHHFYKCLRCKAQIASPTSYAMCEKFGIIVRDMAMNDCYMCPIPQKLKFDPRKQKCPYYREKEIITHPQIEEHITKQLQKLGGSRRNLKVVKDRDEEKYYKK